MNIGFIGAGKAGFTLGKYFSTHGIEVTGYYSRSIRSAREAAAFTSSNVYEDAAGVLSKSDVLFLTVPDGSIRPTYEALARGDIRGKIFCHASGALTAAAAFPGIEQKGASGFSVHPLLAISDRYRSYRELADCFFTLEGPEERRSALRSLLERAGLHVQIIQEEDKARYHLAAATVSNLVCALFAAGETLLTQCGFSEAAARAALAPLFLGNARSVAAAGARDALTGPVERGDLGTLRAHLASLGAREDQLLYLLLTAKLLPLAGARHPERDDSSIKEFLEAETARRLWKG